MVVGNHVLGSPFSLVLQYEFHLGLRMFGQITWQTDIGNGWGPITTLQGMALIDGCIYVAMFWGPPLAWFYDMKTTLALRMFEQKTKTKCTSNVKRLLPTSRGMVINGYWQPYFGIPSYPHFITWNPSQPIECLGKIFTNQHMQCWGAFNATLNALQCSIPPLMSIYNLVSKKRKNNIGVFP